MSPSHSQGKESSGQGRHSSGQTCLLHFCSHSTHISKIAHQGYAACPRQEEEDAQKQGVFGGNENICLGGERFFMLHS